MSYQLIDNATILRIKDGVFIPKEDANADYQEFLEWCKNEGNKPLPFVASEPEVAWLTHAEKLAAAGLTPNDLRSLLDEAVAQPEAGGTDPAGPPPPERIGQEWVGPDGTTWVVVQARGENGQFAADDPSTPQLESLQWAKAAAAVEESAPG